MDAFGNVGFEGSPMVLVNLPAAAQSASEGGGAYYGSDATGASIGTSGGSGYIMFDDGSGVSW